MPRKKRPDIKKGELAERFKKADILEGLGNFTLEKSRPLVEIAFADDYLTFITGPREENYFIMSPHLAGEMRWPKAIYDKVTQPNAVRASGKRNRPLEVTGRTAPMAVIAPEKRIRTTLEPFYVRPGTEGAATESVSEPEPENSL